NMNNRIPPPPRQRNPRLNAVARSALAATEDVQMSDTTTVTAPSIPQDMDATERMFALLTANNGNFVTLAKEMAEMSKRMSGVENGINLTNEINIYLKKMIKEIMAAQDKLSKSTENGISEADSAIKASFSSLMEEGYTPGKRHVGISHALNKYMKNPNLTDTDPLKVAENNEKPGWSTNGTFKEGYNQALAMAVISYLRQQQSAIGVSTNDIARIVKNHYRNQVRHYKTSPDKIVARQRTSRRRNRKISLLKRRTVTYQKYTEEITRLMRGLDCSNVLVLEVMSDDESDTENEVRAHRPSWRSDKLQEFIDVVDKFSVKRLQKKSNSLLKRVRFVKEMSVSQHMSVTLPEWCISTE
ncbi:hypothetical protein INT47_009689, partial [Mucor saturninus]